MTKVVINTCYGGFCLSPEAISRYTEIKNQPLDPDFYFGNIERTDPALVQTVEELGPESWDSAVSRLEIRDITPGTRYRIQEYDGKEWIEFADEIKWSIA